MAERSARQKRSEPLDLGSALREALVAMGDRSAVAAQIQRIESVIDAELAIGPTMGVLSWSPERHNDRAPQWPVSAGLRCPGLGLTCGHG